MKKLLLAAWCIAAALSLQAQPVLHAAALQTVIGAQYNAAKCNYIAAGAVLDFTSLVPANTFVSQCLNPSAGSVADSFPAASFMISGGGQETYFSLGSTALRSEGIMLSPTLVVYTNSITVAAQLPVCTVYPNPACGRFSVRLPHGITTATAYTLTDMSGARSAESSTAAWGIGVCS